MKMKMKVNNEEDERIKVEEKDGWGLRENVGPPAPEFRGWKQHK